MKYNPLKSMNYLENPNRIPLSVLHLPTVVPMERSHRLFMERCSRQSMDLAEVYRVIYSGPVEHLRGAILTSDVDTGFQLLFKDNELRKFTTREIGLNYLNKQDYIDADKKLDVGSFPLIEDEGHILLNGPIEASIGVSSGFSISFYLFGDIHTTITTPPPRGNPDVYSVPLKRLAESEDGNKVVTVLYAFFENAVEAHVKVKITNVKSDFDIYENEKLPIKCGDDEINIELSRRIVGVPLGSQLILQFGLSSDDNFEMVRKSVPINVQNIIEGSTFSHPISCGKCGIRLEISWRCKRGPNTTPVYEWSDSDSDT